jgi:ubiquinone/menaquinone biosynthesis C-methylase UbiE
MDSRFDIQSIGQAKGRTMTTSHAELVRTQFGARAQAYVTSAVHAQGADLDYLVETLSDSTAAKVLDLGCGGGHVTFHAAPRVAHVTAYDLSHEMLAAVAHQSAERGLTNITTQQGVAEVLPFAAATFDVVITRHSAHHWHGFAAALTEVRRVLKPQGRAFFMDVISPGPALLDTYLQCVEMLRDPSHVRDYSLAEWRSALQSAGLTPGADRTYRVRLDFAAWIARMNTPALQAQAIRALQDQMAEDVRRHFEIEADGSFTIDTMFLEAKN